MIDYLHGLVVLAYRHQIFYFEAESKLLDLDEKNEKEVPISEQELQNINIPKSKKIYCLNEIGKRETCAVIEDMQDRTLRFLHLEVRKADDDFGGKEFKI